MTNWHPWIVHFPIAVLPLSVVLDIAALLWRRPAWHSGAYALLVLGTVAAAAAVITGNEAALPYREIDAVNQFVSRHENYGTVSFLAFLAITLGRLPLQLQRRNTGWPIRLLIGAAAIAVGIVWVASLHGGKLVYEHGLGVRIGAITNLERSKFLKPQKADISQSPRRTNQ